LQVEANTPVARSILVHRDSVAYNHKGVLRDLAGPARERGQVRKIGSEVYFYATTIVDRDLRKESDGVLTINEFNLLSASQSRLKLSVEPTGPPRDREATDGLRMLEYIPRLPGLEPSPRSNVS
jgi:hypothetical protein